MEQSKTPKLTHFALRVKNIETTAAFYKKYVNLDLISKRQEHTTRVAWLGNPNVNDSLIIVLLELEHGECEDPSFHHIGISLHSQEEVNAKAEMARQEGILATEPDDYGPVAGYLCLIQDPDGNQVEFSYGQDVYHTLHSTQGLEKGS